MTAEDHGTTRVSVRVADCFLLAHDDFMRRTESRGGMSANRFWNSTGRPIRPGCAGEARCGWVQKAPAVGRAIATGLEDLAAVLGSPLRAGGRIAAPIGGASEVPREPSPKRDRDRWNDGSVAGGHDRLPLTVDGIEFKARLDVVEQRDGRCFVALSWSHLVIDGKGAELLFAEIGRLCDGVDEPCDVRELGPLAGDDFQGKDQEDQSRRVSP